MIDRQALAASQRLQALAANNAPNIPSPTDRMTQLYYDLSEQINRVEKKVDELLAMQASSPLPPSPQADPATE